MKEVDRMWHVNIKDQYSMKEKTDKDRCKTRTGGRRDRGIKEEEGKIKMNGEGREMEQERIKMEGLRTKDGREERKEGGTGRSKTKEENKRKV